MMEHIPRQVLQYRYIQRAVILTYIIHSGYILENQNEYSDNSQPPANVYHRVIA